MSFKDGEYPIKNLEIKDKIVIAINEYSELEERIKRWIRIYWNSSLFGITQKRIVGYLGNKLPTVTFPK